MHGGREATWSIYPGDRIKFSITVKTSFNNKPKTICLCSLNFANIEISVQKLSTK